MEKKEAPLVLLVVCKQCGKAVSGETCADHLKNHLKEMSDAIGTRPTTEFFTVVGYPNWKVKL